MTSPGCAEARMALGAYVLGALDPAERAHVDAHLDGCQACREELAELAVLPGLLGRLDLAEAVQVGTAAAGSPAEPSPELLDRLLAAAALRQRSATRSRVLVAAAAVTVVAAVTAAVTAQAMEHSSGPSGQWTVLRATDATSHVTARVAEAARGWGTAVRVRVANVPQGERCSLVVVSRSGARDVAASWRVNYSGAASVDGATALPTSDIAAYQVITVEGQRLVTVPA